MAGSEGFELNGVPMPVSPLIDPMAFEGNRKAAGEARSRSWKRRSDDSALLRDRWRLARGFDEAEDGFVGSAASLVEGIGGRTITLETTWGLDSWTVREGAGSVSGVLRTSSCWDESVTTLGSVSSRLSVGVVWFTNVAAIWGGFRLRNWAAS